MLGTNPYPFTRLIDEVILWAEDTGEQIVVQSGNTPVKSNAVKSYSFLEHSKIMSLMAEAEVVITQGGFGSLQDCMKAGAKTVAVPRMIELGESMDDQKEIVDALAEEGLVVPLYDVKKLGDAIKAAKLSSHKVVVDNGLPKHIAGTIRHMLGY